jgi:TetR/AcrR family transcriptional repressor of uid operon
VSGGPTASVLARAFDDPEAAPDAGSEQILDAALELAAGSGLRNLTMDDVARRASVGRMTVYRRFGSRAALVDALALRECRRCLQTIAAELDPDAAPDERVAALFTSTLRLIREHPLLARLAKFEPDSLLRELTRDESAVFRLVRQFLIGVIVEGQERGELVHIEPAVLAELAVRLGASFVLIEDTVLPVDDQDAVRAIIAPMLARVPVQ